MQNKLFGRPKKQESEKSVSITITMPKALAKEVKQYSAKNHLNFSEFVRGALRKVLQDVK